MAFRTPAIPKRYIMVILSHSAFFIVFALRVNFSVAIVAMINSTTSSNETEKHHHNKKHDKEGEFNWDEQEQGLVLSAFFYGYILTQLPGGWMALRYGGKKVLGFGILMTSLSSMLSPVAARTNIYFFIVTRILEGLGEGVTQPALYVLVEAWSPLPEQSTISSLCYSGSLTGLIITLPICSALANSDFLGGWPSTFYVFGGLGVVWFAVWMLCIHDTPNHHPTITEEERDYINQSLAKVDDLHTINKTVPWKHIFGSVPVWAIIVAIFCDSWIFNLVSTDLPLYFKNVLDVKIEENGVYTMLPFAVGFISQMGSAVLSDYLIRKKVPIALTRRIMSSLATYLAAISVFVATYATPGQSALPVTCFMMCNFFLQINKSGCFMNGFDISPRFVSIIFGISNTIAAIPGFVVPLVTGAFTQHNASQANYRKVFILAAAVSVFGGTFFNIFVKGEKQAWNDLRSTNVVNPVPGVQSYSNTNDVKAGEDV